MFSAIRHMCLVLALATAAPALGEVDLPPAIAGDPWLKDLRRSMLKGRDLSDRELQTLADAGEGLAAARYAKRLEARRDPAFLDDAAHYYSIAVFRGRDFAVPRLIALLGSPQATFGPARLRNLREVLERAARRGDLVAAAGLADLLLQDAPFERDVVRAQELLLQVARGGDAQAAIRLALAHIEGSPGVSPDHAAAREAIDLAMTSPDPGVQAMAMTLSRRLSGSTELATAPALPPLPVANAPDVRFAEPAGPGALPRPRPRPATLEGAAP